jgi:hypothetical protein
MFEGHASLCAVERGQVCAYLLGTRLPHMQPGADRAHRRHVPGRKLDRECLRSLRLRGSASGMHSGAPRRAESVPGNRAERIIIMSSSYEPTSATVGHTATAAPVRPCPRP